MPADWTGHFHFSPPKSYTAATFPNDVLVGQREHKQTLHPFYPHPVISSQMSVDALHLQPLKRLQQAKPSDTMLQLNLDFMWSQLQETPSLFLHHKPSMLVCVLRSPLGE